jgi:hypothetical protein
MVLNGVPMVCYGDHDRHEDCEWVPLDGSVSELTREQIQQGWRDYDAAIAGDIKLGVYGPTINPPVVNVPEPFPVSGEWIRDEFHPTGCGCGQHVDLYDKPIDLRPAPKRDIVREVVEHLRNNGDYFGVKLIESGFIGEDSSAEEDAEDTERARQA